MSDSTADNDPLVSNPTWTGNIQAFFDAGEVACMKAQGIDLSSYDSVKANAPAIYQQTSSGNMPLGGPPWSANRVQTFKNWMDTGYPKSPRAGGSGGVESGSGAAGGGAGAGGGGAGGGGAGAGGGGAGAGDDPLVEHPTWLGEVRYFFRPQDVACMKPRGIDLSSYDAVKEHATNIYLQTQAGFMPYGGPRWSDNRVKTFLNWITAGYPMGTAAVETAGPTAAAAPGVRVRKNIAALSGPERDLLIKAFRGILAKDPTDQNSYFYQASVHGVPLLYCMHHVQPFAPWHRIYMRLFEDALRSVPGCEDVTLPYWDVTTQAPDFLWQDPFASYTVPVDLQGYGPNYTTQRNSAQEIYDNYQQAPSIASSIASAVRQAKFGAYQTIGFEYYLVQGHDNAHDGAGPTLGDPLVASYDPIFWFFHCNWDRVWASWQHNAGATTIAGFTSTLHGDTDWLKLQLNPWAGDSTTTVSEPDVAYDQLIEADTDTLHAKLGSIHAGRSFSLAANRKVSIRVKDINRLNIPGTFVVNLLADGEQIARQAFFQPPVPKDCPTCGAQALVSVDFRIEQEAIADKTLSIAINVPSLGQGEMGRFPLSNAGDPTINARLLLEDAA
jgi:hypothetical protein